MAHVLCYELVFGEGIKPHGPAERAILKAADALIASAETLKAEAGVADLAKLRQASTFSQHPRAARVNTLMLSTEVALQSLQTSVGPAKV